MRMLPSDGLVSFPSKQEFHSDTLYLVSLYTPSSAMKGAWLSRIKGTL